MTGLHVWHFFNISFYLAGSIPISILKPSIHVFLSSYPGVFCFVSKGCCAMKETKSTMRKHGNLKKKKKVTPIHQEFLDFF